MRSLIGKTVLVTGGAGFIGSHFCDNLLTQGVRKVVCLDNFFLGNPRNISKAMENKSFSLYRDDARNYGVLEAIMNVERIDIVFNLATIALNYSFFNPFDAYQVNVQIADSLLKLLKAGSYETLIHVSSSEAYGTALYSPMDENHPTNPTTPYAAGKASADMLLLSFAKILPLDISIVRPFNNYGPRQNPDGSLAAIIPATIRRILSREQPILEGDGGQTRDFMHVDDTVQGIILAYENENSRGQIVNLGSGIEISIKNLLDTISKNMKYEGGYDQRPARISDVRSLCADTRLATSVLGFEPKVRFEDGLNQTVEWFVNRYARQ